MEATRTENDISPNAWFVGADAAVRGVEGNAPQGLLL
jgi:hypothetical protein